MMMYGYNMPQAMCFSMHGETESLGLGIARAAVATANERGENSSTITFAPILTATLRAEKHS